MGIHEGVAPNPAQARPDDATDWFASEGSLRSVLDVGVDALVLIDAAGRILEWNRAAERTFGWTRAEAVGAEVSELLGSDELRAAHRSVAEGTDPMLPGAAPGDQINLSARHRDGRDVPIEMRLSAVDVGGRPHIVTFLRDMTESRETQTQLRRFESVLASSDDAIISGAVDGTIETWNPAAERLFGYSAEEMIGTDIGRLGPAGEPAGADEERRRAIGEGQSVSIESRERRRDGSLVDVAATFAPMRDDDERIVGFTAIARDVTERNAAAARLAQAHSQFEGAFEAADIGMALVAPDGNFLAVNPALCRLFKRDAETLLASSYQEITHPDDLEDDLGQVARTLAGELDGFRMSKRYLLPDGGIVWGRLTVTLVRDVDGTPSHFVSQIQDIGDRKTAEGEMRRYARHLEALSNQDPLTGLANRRAFSSALSEELNVQVAGGSACSVLMIAVDGDDSAIAAVAALVTRSGRDDNLVAHLGAGELAVLLPGVDEPTANTILERMRNELEDRAGVHFAQATARPGDEPAAAINRAREALGPRGDSTATEATAPGHVRRLLEFARRQLGMPLSFVTRLEGDEYVFERMAGDGSQFGVAEGEAMPLDGSHCIRMLDGRIGSVVHDLATEPETRDLEITKTLGLRAYAGVPVRLRSGDVYGTLCAVDTRPHPELSERQIELLRFAAELTAELIDAVTDDQADRLAESSATGVRTLLVALDARDFYTGEHSKKVVDLASAVARRLGLGVDEISDVEQVALLHDVGKVGIPDVILQKQGPLDDQEWELMRQHPVVGERIIVGTPGLSHLAPAMRAEHERWDGAGYPDGLVAEEIPLASRITLACDAFHAMTSERPYRPAMTIEHACEELRSCAGTQFDPNVAEALLAEIGSLPAGDAVATPRTHS